MGNATEKFGRVDEFPGGHKVIHRTAQTAFARVVTPRLPPPKAHKLSEKQVNEMRNWRAMYGQSVPQKTVRNMTTKDNPINLYAADSLCSL